MDIKEISTIVSNRIKGKRREKGWNQTELAEHAGITSSALSQIESGERFPSTVVLHKLAKTLGTSVDYLLGKEEEELSDLLGDKKMQVFFRSFKELSSKDRELIRKHVEFLKSQQKK